jgi:hypothetical protein
MKGRALVGLCVVSAVTFGLASSGGANDSTAGLANGGLVLTKSADIEMQSEDLYISAKQVRVRYGFLNTSTKDITVTVAFPLPDVTTNGFDDNLAIPLDKFPDFVGFSTVVDGKPVTTQLEQKALKNGVDETAFLQKLGVGPQLMDDRSTAVINHLTQAAKDQLVKLGLIVDTGSGDPTNEYEPTWTLKTTYYWSQTFPAGKPVIVQHSYTPSVGGLLGSVLAYAPGPSDAAATQALADTRKEYCVDDDLYATATALTKASPDSFALYDEYIDYVLTTGANWKAPIGDFRMTIDKGAANNLVSFCGTNVQKTGATTFQVHYLNFTPTADVHVLILSRTEPK